MTGGRLLLAVLLAVAVPAVSLHAAAVDRRADGLTAAPFATVRLLIAHLVTALPLGLLIAVRWNSRSRFAGRREAAVRALVAVVATAATLVGSRATESSGLSFFALATARSVISVGLATAWLAVVLKGLPRPSNGWSFAVAGLFALGPPALYADRLRESQASSLKTYRENGRLVRALSALEGLSDLGGTEGISASRRALERECKSALDATRIPPDGTAPSHVFLIYAFQLIQLERTVQAEAVLLPLVEQRIEAALILSSLYRDQERWDEAYACARRAIGQLETTSDTTFRSAAYDACAESARGAGRYSDAEQVLREAIQRFPRQAAYYQLQLGRHFRDGGRPFLALEHLRRSEKADPNGHGEEARRLMKSIRRSTPACILK